MTQARHDTAHNTGTLERVMQCQTLPTLPGVAMRVLEITQDKNVSTQEIAATVQNDPALTARVLRTVNSSFYGLNKPCPSITRATGLLGITTVKSIVLGFSLVETSRRAGINQSFDMLAYWRRAVYSASGARLLALSTNACDPEEAFVGALVQDIGVLAFASTLRDEYDPVVSGENDHDKHLAAEVECLGTDHCRAGAALAQRWRLPEPLFECIRWHHQPERCRPEYAALLRVVASAGYAAAFLADVAAKPLLDRFVVSMREWFGIEPGASRSLLAQINESAQSLAKSMDVKAGESADLSTIMAQAHAQLIENQVEMQRETLELTRQTVTDALTGAYNRAHFDREVAQAFDRSNEERVPLAVLFCDADRFKSINDTHGHQAGDAVLKELASRLAGSLGKIGTVCRYGGEEFAVVVPGADAARALKVGEVARRLVCSAPFVVSSGTEQLSLAVTISVGVAAHHPGVGHTFESAAALVHAADECVYEAKNAGRNCVRSKSCTQGSPTAAAAADRAGSPPRGDAAGGAARQQPASTLRLLAVEDDPLAARLFTFIFSKERGFEVTVYATGEEAMRAIGDGHSPDLILCDINLPDMTGVDVVRRIKGNAATQNIPIIVISATSDGDTRARAEGAGADDFADKGAFAADSDPWCMRVRELVERSRGMGRRSAA
ncbi:MAG: HDOD domain-containing protein [Phycisphaeraceae bacterium]|nr:HDOD domain-containing protein [Phycisphaeraceae bacterium]